MGKKLPLSLPFEGEWHVFSGGDTAKLNLHRSSNPLLVSQQYAFDFVKPADVSKTHFRKGADNSEYETFGQQIIAPADGIVVEASDGVEDNLAWKTTDIFNVCGNHVLIKHADELYSLLCHFQCGSVGVKAGDKVVRGQLLGKAGNSGNSTEPHLHFHLQDKAEFTRWAATDKFEPAATGIKAYFSNIMVKKNGKARPEKLYSPVKGDVISNA